MSNQIPWMTETTVLNPTLLLITKTAEFPGMPGCDDIPDEWIEMREDWLVNIESLESVTSIKVTWEIAKKYYEQAKKGNWGRDAYIHLWRLFVRYAPYDALPARTQKRLDLNSGDYPRIESKYFDKIKLEELKDLLSILQVSYAENKNDSRIYDRKEYSSYRELGRIRNLTEIIEMMELKNRIKP